MATSSRNRPSSAGRRGRVDLPPATGQLVAFQEMGFGIAVALALDASSYGCCSSPPAMRLLGEHNWSLRAGSPGYPTSRSKDRNQNRRRTTRRTTTRRHYSPTESR